MSLDSRSLVYADLICPDCQTALTEPQPDDGRIRCSGCDRSFPMADQVPVLLPLDSAFDAEAIAAGRDTYYQNRKTESPRLHRARTSLPGLAWDSQKDDADALVNDLLSGASGRSGRDSVDALVIGAGFRVEEYAGRFPRASWLVTDVEASFGADLVGDVTSLPVADASQDFVLCEHVLEHVLDPLAAAREIERVLRPGGIALIKVPFNYPWHGGYIDFYRFTPAGYLAAFRRLEAVHIGHGPGPVSTINYAMQSAWTSLFTSRNARRIAVAVGRIVLGPWRRLDRWMVHRQGSLGTACSLVFIGRRTDHVRTPTEVVAQAKALGVGPVIAPSQRLR